MMSKSLYVGRQLAVAVAPELRLELGSGEPRAFFINFILLISLCYDKPQFRHSAAGSGINQHEISRAQMWIIIFCSCRLQRANRTQGCAQSLDCLDIPGREPIPPRLGFIDLFD